MTEEVDVTNATIWDGSEAPDFSPPLGIAPESVWRRDRAIAITDAMRRYVVADHDIPNAWFDELKRLAGEERS